MSTLPRASDSAADPDLVPVLARAAAGVPHVLDLTYLPQVDLASGEVVGVDVKLRIAHPHRGLLSPAQFWPAARAAGLISSLARQAVRRCAREVGTPEPQGSSELRVWIALPGVLVHDPFLPAQLAELAAELAPRTLVLQFGGDGLELTPDLAARIAALRGAGATVAVDDALAWCDWLPSGPEVDAVRLSPRLVRAVTSWSSRGAYPRGAYPRGVYPDVTPSVAGLVRLAHRHGLVVAAAGVESWDEGARLCDLGCERASGYLFSPPLTGERANGLLRGHASWVAPNGGLSSVPSPRPVPPH